VRQIEDVAARLIEFSSKAKENGERYARLTAENATAVIARGRQEQGLISTILITRRFL
jgi:hypothetical protein